MSNLTGTRISWASGRIRDGGGLLWSGVGAAGTWSRTTRPGVEELKSGVEGIGVGAEEPGFGAGRIRVGVKELKSGVGTVRKTATGGGGGREGTAITNT